MKLRIVAVAGAAALGLVACGSSAGHSGMPGMEGATSITAAGTAANPADVTFAQGMIPHHQQAVAMASLALDAKAGASDKVRAVAMRIKDAQDPERVVIASKQIYASHYIRVGLDLTALVDAPRGAPGFYLMDLFRGRIDPPGGMFATVILGKIRGSIESSMGASLASAKAKLETR